jgi:DNA-binding IclR family transcriptional regulator
MSSTNAPENSVSTVDTAFDILEILLARNGASLTEIANEVGLAKSTVHRHLQTLHRRKYVVREDNNYYLSSRFLEFGKYAQNRKKGYRMAKEKVKELATETEERAQFLIEEHGQAVYIHRETGNHAVQTDPGLGKCIPLYATSAGKAILTHLPDERVEEIFDQNGLVAMTKHTKINRKELFEEFERIRERGYSVNKQENVEGLHAIGTPVRDRAGDILGALSVSGPTHRMNGEWFEEELPNLLLGTANELELNIAHS